MAEYYPLIKKAVARLDSSARESRQVIYDRARAAQLAQLRTIRPPLPRSEIAREQLALEEAVRRVEADVAQLAPDPQVLAISDLVAAADEIGKPLSRVENSPSVVQAKVLANSFSPVSTLEMPLSMIFWGRATGRLVRYWRWRALPPRLAASERASGS